MIKVLFVCHGNICRSPMAEFILKDMVKKKGLEDYFYIASAATSREEIGNPVHPGTRNILRRANISCDLKRAVQMTKNDYTKYDYILAMDKYNIRNIYSITGGDSNHKIGRLLDYSKNPRDIADPWYTDNFELTYQDVIEGCESFINYLIEKNII